LTTLFLAATSAYTVARRSSAAETRLRTPAADGTLATFVTVDLELGYSARTPDRATRRLGRTERLRTLIQPARQVAAPAGRTIHHTNHSIMVAGHALTADLRSSRPGYRLVPSIGRPTDSSNVYAVGRTMHHANRSIMVAGVSLIECLSSSRGGRKA
jgi:hypothetical protein